MVTPTNTARIRDQRDARTHASESDLDWAAGLFEGEGTITINSGGRLGYTRCFVILSNTDFEVVQFFQDRWPGTWRVYTPKGNAREVAVWALNSGIGIRTFIDEVGPHLRSARVKRKFEVVRADIEARLQGSRDADYKERCQERMAVIRQLNKRGAIS